MPALQHHNKDLSAVCRKVAPDPRHMSLVEMLGTILPDHSFHHAMTRADWHRIGGLVDANHKRIAKGLRHWAENESDFNMFALYEKYGAQGHLTTRLDGQTHYFVAATGKRAAEFIQLEIEELVEVIDHPLFIGDQVPDDIEELLDPPAAFAARLEPVMMAPSHYEFHSLTDVSELVSEQLASEGSDLRYIRFLDEWNKSSAGTKTHFCNHFVLRLLPFRDRFGEYKTEATPLPVTKMAVPGDSAVTLNGTELANFLHGYDKKAGFPMAWYFAMLTQKEIWPHIAMTVYREHQGKYRYLSDRDVAVLERWIRSPYSF